MADIDKEEVEALQEELACVQMQGYARQQQWLSELFSADAEKLTFGEITDERQRLHAEGRCQAYKRIMQRKSEIEEAWRALQEEMNKETEELEGGDYGLHYEAAQ